MSVFCDRQMKKYWYFLFCFFILCALFGASMVAMQGRAAQKMMLSHDNAVVTSLMDQRIPKSVIAAAIAETEESRAGGDFLASIGRTEQTAPNLFPLIAQYQERAGIWMTAGGGFLMLILLAGTFAVFWRRDRLYRQAEGIVSGFMKGDYSRRLPQNGEGTVYQLFASVDRLATMLKAKNEAEHQRKEFLKETISDISHQLKTPLAALSMYQEILEEEPDHPDTVKAFAAKMRLSLERMNRLILSMLKITRLDAGNIVFEQASHQVSEVIMRAVSELMTRADSEKKKICLEGPMEDTVFCDLEWTGEAVGNIVKNGLDHTSAGGCIRITYEPSPCVARIVISDDGDGIAAEDIHHVFKRFYRSRNSLDTQGVGLGLPLAKSIIEGQGGTVSVQSEPGSGAVFTISLLTKL